MMESVSSTPASSYFTANLSLSKENLEMQDSEMIDVVALQTRIAVLKAELAHQIAKTDAARDSLEMVIKIFSAQCNGPSLTHNLNPSESSLSSKLKVKEQKCAILRRKLDKEKIKVGFMRMRNENMKKRLPYFNNMNSTLTTLNEHAKANSTSPDLISLNGSVGESRFLAPKEGNKPLSKSKMPGSVDQPSPEEPYFKLIHHFVPSAVRDGAASSYSAPAHELNHDIYRSACTKIGTMTISPDTESPDSAIRYQISSRSPPPGKNIHRGRVHRNEPPHLPYDEAEVNEEGQDDRSRFAKWKNSTNGIQKAVWERKRMDYSDIDGQ